MRVFQFLMFLVLFAPSIAIAKHSPCANVDEALAGGSGERSAYELAHAQYAAAACTLPVDDLAPEQAAMLLGGAPTAISRNGDVMTIVARSESDNLRLCCSLQAEMTRIGEDLWAVRYRLARLDEAMLQLAAWSKDGPPAGFQFLEWRGQSAPKPPEHAQSLRALRGQVSEIEFRSDALGETRQVEIYLPPGHAAGNPVHVLIAADGVGFVPFLLEPLMRDGLIPQMAVVGLPSGAGAITEDRSELGISDLRSVDYLPRFDKVHDRFRKHQTFVFDELLPALLQSYGFPTDADSTIVTGYSNGAVFALHAALDRPDLFGAAIVISAGHLPTDPVITEKRAVFFMSAGLYEATFIMSTSASAENLSDAGYDVVYKEYVAGHAPDQWNVALVDGLNSLFAEAAE